MERSYVYLASVIAKHPTLTEAKYPLCVLDAIAHLLKKGIYPKKVAKMLGMRWSTLSELMERYPRINP